MKTKIKRNQKGVAHVKMKCCTEQKDQSTCRKANIIDMEMVEVRHAGKDSEAWNCLEAMGTSDKGEREYTNPFKEEIDIDREQLRQTHVGRMLLRLSRQKSAIA